MHQHTDMAMPSKAPLYMSIVAAAFLTQAFAAAEKQAAPASLTAEQIVEKHVAARGGLQAWHAVHTLAVTGRVDAGTPDSITRSTKMAMAGPGAFAKRPGAAKAALEANKGALTHDVQLPFRLEMKRPRKSRLEVEFAGKTAVQVYDGKNGWKLRPYLNRDDVEPFTTDEAKSEAAKFDLEGPLVDYAAQGTKVALEGTEQVDGHSAYKLKLTLKNGDVRRVWIDAQNFLDVKVEGLPHRMDGKMRTVWVYQRDFKVVDGLKVPFQYETAVSGYPRTHKMMVDAVRVNPALDDARFAKPQLLVAAASPQPAKSAPGK
jgi:outer membrane lipoprotein-sorting protein